MKTVLISFLCLLLSSSFVYGDLNVLGGDLDSTGAMPNASFRITFGLRDNEPNAWDGEVIAKEDQIIKVEPDRFHYHQNERTVWVTDGPKRLESGDPHPPNDYLKSETSWICSTHESPLHGPTTEWHVRGRIDELKTFIQQPSIFIHLYGDRLDQSIQIKTLKGNFSFIPQDMISRRTGYFLDKNIKVEVIPSLQRVSADNAGQQDFPSILYSKSGKLWVAWQEYNNENSDRVLIRNISVGVWDSIYVLAEEADAFHTALAEDLENRIWAVWSMQVDSRWDLYGRFYDGTDWSEQKRLTNSNATKNIYHQLETDSEGRMWLFWQGTIDGYSQIYAKNFDGRQWSQEKQVSEGYAALGNNWWPSIAAGPDGSMVVAWDGYASGNYDVYLRHWKSNSWGEVQIVAGTAGFEAHPSVAFDHNNRIWIAWDESGINWGKDKGFLLQDRKTTQLHESRSIGIACLDGNKWFKPEENVNQVLSEGEFWELPHLQIDSQGKPVLFVRHLLMREPDTPLEGPIDLALWEIQMTHFNGSQWVEPVCLPHSTGRNDMMPATTLDDDGNIWAVWATDLRDEMTFMSHQLQIQLSKIANTNSEMNLALKPYSPLQTGPDPKIDEKEAEQVNNIRAYRIHNSGKTYSIFRGDLHRHTDISHDGHNDGSLLDAYRYARDAASLDFLGVSDHTTNVWDQYNWWRNQKVADIFQNKNSFVAFYGYERSVPYPNGHRNIFFIKRGTANVLPVDPSEAQGTQGSGRLYWYLRRNNGFSVPHTPGRNSGTDWRDNDPKVESLIEIYQGMRDSYEYPNSPRPYELFSLPDTTKPVPRASSAESSPSFKALGFAWNALEKGYKLGFIASSDHISTHISYACLIAEELTPESLLEAVRERRAYAATDNIILDVQHIGSDGAHLMGELFESNTPLQIEANFIGTDTIQQIDIIKNNAIVRTYNPNQIQYSFEYLDTAIKDGVSYYYLRIIQKDGNMAWGSPVWVTYK